MKITDVSILQAYTGYHYIQITFAKMNTGRQTRTANHNLAVQATAYPFHLQKFSNQKLQIFFTIITQMKTECQEKIKPPLLRRLKCI